MLVIISLLCQSAYALIPARCGEVEKTDAPSTSKKAQLQEVAFNNKTLLAKQLNDHRKTIYRVLVKQGISAKNAKQVYRLEFLERPIASSKAQPEFTMTIDAYTSKLLRNELIAKSFMQEHMQTLLNAEQKYGVDKEIIVALITMESMAGRRKGDIRILDSLFTLSYSSRRSSFFTDELVAAFKLMESGKHNFAFETTGSWAGAMGYTQFMPSSLLHYGVDGDNDGMVDIINNPRDAIYSAALYLNKAGWKYGEKILKEISEADLSGVDICSAVNKPFEGGKLTLQEASPRERFFIVYNNYNSILRWNRSFLFAYTAHTISQKLKENNS